MAQSNPLHGLVAVLWSKESFKRGMYPLHVEELGETIKKNMQYNVKPDPQADKEEFINDWHIVGVFTNHEQAMEFAGRFGESMKIVAWTEG